MTDQDSTTAISIDEPGQIVTGAITDGRQVIAHDGYDVQAFDEAVEAFSRLGRTLIAVEKQIKTGPALLCDLFWSFHKSAPRIAPPAQLMPAYEINQQILTEVMSTAEWREMREIGTIGDQFASALATIGASEKAITVLGTETISWVNQLEELSVEVEELFSKAEVLEELAQAAGPDRADSLESQAENARAEAEEKQKQTEQLKQRLDVTREGREQRVRQATRHGMAEALAEIEQMNQAVNAFAGGSESGFGINSAGSGKSDTLSTKEKLAIARQINKSAKLQKLAAISGRFKRIALQQQKSRVKHQPDEVTSIRTGNEIERLLPAEIALLTAPELEDLFYLKFSERSLMQYDLDGQKPQGQGPIIVAIDESGSMTCGCDGLTSEIWSKAVMLGLLSIARLQKRDFAVIHFSGDDDLKVDHFPKGEGTHSEIISCASFFYGGGTAFGPWMNKALELVDSSRFEKADVICISDGISYVPPEAVDQWKKVRAERGMRAYSVLIGTEYGKALLNEISDAVFYLGDLRDDLPALEVIFTSI
jgi:uncharacterized protein with von Willebrand factor type A (vWA) domain